MVSNLIRGQPLAKFFGKPIPANTRQRIRNTIGALHKKGIIHGDLHRNNIIITNEGKPVLIDFGKALNTGQSFNSINKAHHHLKQLGFGGKVSHGKNSYFSNKKQQRSHFSNKNFINRLNRFAASA